MIMVGSPKVFDLRPNQDASRLSERSGGRAFSLKLRSVDGSLEAEWQAELRDGANYIKTNVTFSAVSGDIPIKEIELIGMDSIGAAGRSFK